MQLSKDQKVAVNLLTKWYQNYTAGNDDIAIVKGLAGTGKSTIVSEFMKNVHITNQNIVTLASSGIAVKNIRDKTQTENAMTIASFIKTPQTTYKLVILNDKDKIVKEYPLRSTGDRGERGSLFDEIIHMVKTRRLCETNTDYQKLKNELSIQKTQYLQNLKDQPNVSQNPINIALSQLFELSNKQTPQLYSDVNFSYRKDVRNDEFDLNKQFNGPIKLLVIDEVGMVSQPDLDVLIRIAHQLAIPVVGLGDEHQLLPVKAKDFNWQLLQPAGTHTKNGTTVYTAELTQVHRQSNTSYLSILAKEFTQDTSLYDGLMHVMNQANGQPINDINVLELNRISNQKRETIFTYADVILTYTNKDVKNLTKVARFYRFKKNLPPIPYQGETILITQNESGNNFGFKNGERFIIDKVYDDEEVYQLGLGDDGKPIKSWVTAYNNMKNLVRCFDLRELNSNKVYHRCWISLSKFDDPKVSYKLLMNTLHDDTCRRLHHFQQNVLSHGLAGEEVINTIHNQILFATFGYALTVHKAQGLEFDNVIYYEPSWQIQHTDLTKLRYTAITRAKQNLLVLTDQF